MTRFVRAIASSATLSSPVPDDVEATAHAAAEKDGVRLQPPAELTRIFFQQMRVHGSTMGTRDELARLVELCDVSGVRPLIDREIPMEDAAEGLAAVAAGDVFGKIVLTR